MDFKSVLVIGAGQMGSGIAQVMAQGGLEVVLRDIKEEFVRKGIAGIEKNLAKSVEKGKMTPDEMQAVVGRISGVVELDAAACDVDMVVEAAIENMEIKKSIFQQLDQLCPAHTILATNTSSLPVTAIAALTKRPDKVLGVHFFNPAPVMKLVELIKGLATSEATFVTVKAFIEKLGKSPVKVEDFPGFIGNRAQYRREDGNHQRRDRRHIAPHRLGRHWIFGKAGYEIRPEDKCRDNRKERLGCPVEQHPAP